MCIAVSISLYFHALCKMLVWILQSVCTQCVCCCSHRKLVPKAVLRELGAGTREILCLCRLLWTKADVAPGDNES